MHGGIRLFDIENDLCLQSFFLKIFDVNAVCSPVLNDTMVLVMVGIHNCPGCFFLVLFFCLGSSFISSPRAVLKT